MDNKKYSKIGFLKLLYKTLNVINKKSKQKLNNLIILVIIQSIFDVISLASLMPLIQIISNKDKLDIYIQSFLSGLGLNKFISFDISSSFYIPLTVILIMIITTIIRLYVVYRTNNFVEEVRHQISSRLMEGYIKSDIKQNTNSSEVAKSILSEVDQFIIIVKCN